ncbi:MAG: aminotransferase class I/II-fold pyridoxal phosphate-dependent enzyme [Thermoplasmata archaeon]|nr:aminotransferase class I/II-fold pyridoxal phosphate-dependent enzyme [Thermoplasmata archaeon]
MGDKTGQTYIVDALKDVPKYIRWCTPSILPAQKRVTDVYSTDISVSAHFLGSYVDNTGIFKKAHERAARVYGADRTLFTVNGTTGSNFIVMRMISLENDAPQILVTRNIHHSILHAAEWLGVRFRFIKCSYDPQFESLIPPRPEDVLDTLNNYPESNAVIISSPTYNGFVARIKDITKAVKNFDKEIKVIVDEAWGSHLHFSDSLPESAMDAGADIAVQSTHKEGGSLQQTGMIHWKEKYVDSDLMLAAFREYVTTSPSYHLLASLDAVTAYMERNGKRTVEDMLKKSQHLKDLLGEKVIPPMRIMDDSLELDLVRDYISGYDRAKTVVALTKFRETGFEVASILAKKYRIVVEKGGLNTLLFLTTFQIKEEDVDKTAEAMVKIMKRLRKTDKKELIPNPFKHVENKPVIEPHVARRVAETIGRKVPLQDAIGKIAAEHVEVYPPGIPVILEGFRITQDNVRYLLKVKEMGGHISARDPELKTIYVL